MIDLKLLFMAGIAATSLAGPAHAVAPEYVPSFRGGVAPSVQADGGSTVILPDAVSYEYLGVVFAMNIRTSTSVGTLTYAGPGCGGLCSATTQLGFDPFASATVDEVAYDYSGGGTATSSLGYYVEYLNAPGTYRVALHAPDSLFTGSASVSTYLEFGQASNDLAHFNNFASIELAEQDSTDQDCHSCGLANTVPHFKPDQIVQMVANTPYFVQIGVNLDLEGTGVPNGATVDPTFSDHGLGGSFVFSPGVAGNTVPEPATWAMLLAGFCIAGTAIRAARRPACGTARV